MSQAPPTSPLPANCLWAPREKEVGKQLFLNSSCRPQILPVIIFKFILELLAKRISNVNNHLPTQSHAFKGNTVDLITLELCKDLRGGWNFGQIIVALCAADRSPWLFIAVRSEGCAALRHLKTAAAVRGRVRDSCPINLLFHPAVRFLKKGWVREKRDTQGFFFSHSPPGIPSWLPLPNFVVVVSWKSAHQTGTQEDI